MRSRIRAVQLTQARGIAHRYDISNRPLFEASSVRLRREEFLFRLVLP
jgi:hypothetical protein